MTQYDTPQKRELFALHLIEALPYIQRLYGMTIVIKIGGNVVDNPVDKLNFAQDISLLHCVGINPVVVHGGGPQITQMMEKLGKEATFIHGQRVTDQETMDITQMVLSGTIGKELVSAINSQGGKAVSLSGKDAHFIQAQKLLSTRRVGDQMDVIDMGFVGEITYVDPTILKTLESANFVPVISPVGVGKDGYTYNINADLAAGKIAAALKAERLVLLTDTPGILRDQNEPSSLFSTLTIEEVEKHIEDEIIKGGMIPKVNACLIALQGGVKKTHIIDGRSPHSILLELFTDEGIGTEIVG